MFGFLKKVFGTKEDREKKAMAPLIEQINQAYAALTHLSHDELRNKTLEFRQYLADSLADIDHDIAAAESDAAQTEDVYQQQKYFDEIDELKKKRDKELETRLTDLLPEAFAVVKETARRFKENGELVVTATDHDRQLAGLGKDFVRIDGDRAIWSSTWTAAGNKIKWDMAHYDVQLYGGIVLHQGKIAEMATGEGKTLVSTLPAYLNGLSGLGVHIVTVNNYLARRDAEWMGPLHQFLLLTVGCIDLHEPNSPKRATAYRCDIVYGTNNEFGFDYLRDNMVRSKEETVQGKFHYAMVDEVDSVLVDDARTPLIISGPVGKDNQVQQYLPLKPRIEKLYEEQKQLAIQFLNEAKQLIKEGKTGPKDGEGGLALLRAHRSLPKYKPLIKFLSEPGMLTILQKAENHYLQEQARNMPFVDEPLYFVIEEKQRNVQLKDQGIEHLTRAGEDPELFVLPNVATEMAEIENSDLDKVAKDEARNNLLLKFEEKSELVHSLNQLLKAYTLFNKDDEYVVMDGQVKIVDEQTGRIMEGRRYSDGLHQALEAKENVKIENATQTYATITLQNFFRMYHKLAGMTGTAETEASELWDIYKLDVVVIPTNRPIAREDKDDLVFKTKREKFNAIIEDIVALRNAGRPVLVGTTTVEVSELLSRMLDLRSITHQVLNAKLHQREAEIVALAGQPGTVTIATNMAGRGTDIKLTAETKEAGGLAIIGTERHDSRRVDRQLRGRSGRQGDPGSSQFYVSLEDDLMRLFSSDRVAKMMDRMGHKEGEVIQHPWITKSIERAQKKVEENNFGIRKRLLEYDDVMNAQREVIYKRRRHALHGDRIRTDVANMFFELVEAQVLSTHPSRDFEGFRLGLLSDFGIEPPVEAAAFATAKPEDLAWKTYARVEELYRLKSADLAERAHPVILRIHDDPTNDFQQILVPFTDGRKTLQVPADIRDSVHSQGRTVIEAMEKGVVLAIIDQYWKEHLRSMDDLRSNVQNARYEQKDPLLIYKFESYELFRSMVVRMNAEVAAFLMKCTIPTQPVAPARMPSAADAPRVSASKEGVRNMQEQLAAGRPQAPTRQSLPVPPSLRPQAGMPSPPPPKVQPVRVEPKVLPNDPCPCGSGLKYKKCHGA
jgi:preprotein translocase subunit SecA